MTDRPAAWRGRYALHARQGELIFAFNCLEFGCILGQLGVLASDHHVRCAKANLGVVYGCREELPFAVHILKHLVTVLLDC